MLRLVIVRFASAFGLVFSLGAGIKAKVAEAPTRLEELGIAVRKSMIGYVFSLPVFTLMVNSSVFVSSQRSPVEAGLRRSAQRGLIQGRGLEPRWERGFKPPCHRHARSSGGGLRGKTVACPRTSSLIDVRAWLLFDLII